MASCHISWVNLNFDQDPQAANFSGSGQDLSHGIGGFPSVKKKERGCFDHERGLGSRGDWVILGLDDAEAAWFCLLTMREP